MHTYVHEHTHTDMYCAQSWGLCRHPGLIVYTHWDMLITSPSEQDSNQGQALLTSLPTPVPRSRPRNRPTLSPCHPRDTCSSPQRRLSLRPGRQDTGKYMADPMCGTTEGGFGALGTPQRTLDQDCSTPRLVRGISQQQWQMLSCSGWGASVVWVAE